MQVRLTFIHGGDEVILASDEELAFVLEQSVNEQKLEILVHEGNTIALMDCSVAKISYRKLVNSIEFLYISHLLACLCNVVCAE